jgi:hypothetical protein
MLAGDQPGEDQIDLGLAFDQRRAQLPPGELSTILKHGRFHRFAFHGSTPCQIGKRPTKNGLSTVTYCDAFGAGI